MSDEVLIALIGAVVSIVAAYLTAQKKADERMQALREEIVVMRTKMDLLWEIYAEDAVKEARSAGLAQRNSPLRITDRWDEVVPADLRTQIKEEIIRCGDILRAPYDVAVEVFAEHGRELKEIARAHDIRLQAFFGVIYVMALEHDDTWS